MTFRESIQKCIDQVNTGFNVSPVAFAEMNRMKAENPNFYSLDYFQAKKVNEIASKYPFGAETVAKIYKTNNYSEIETQKSLEKLLVRYTLEGCG